MDRIDELRIPLAYARLMGGTVGTTVSSLSMPKGKVPQKKESAALYNAILAVDCPYAYRHFATAFSKRPWFSVVTKGPGSPIVDGTDEGSQWIKDHNVVLQIDEYERVDWDVVMKGGKAGDASFAPVTNNFCIRKGLSRKANFAVQMQRHARRFPESAIAKALPETALIDTVPVFHSRPHWLDLRSALSEALLDADEAIDQAAKQKSASNNYEGASAPLWILKPSLGNKAAEIAIVSSIDEVTALLKANRDLGQWVLQRYIERPLLLNGGRKFHIRLYVLVNAAMEVFVFREALLLFAVNSYSIVDGGKDTNAHITNTCVNAEHSAFDETKFVKRFSDLPALMMMAEDKERKAASASAASALGCSFVDRAAALYSRICAVVADCFLALERETSVYMPLERAFELYGADFVLEEQEEEVSCHLASSTAIDTIAIPSPRILEFNPTPDIKQTGKRLDFMIEGLVEGVMQKCIDTRFPGHSSSSSSSSASPSSSSAVRETMREAPIADLQRSYKDSWLRLQKGAKEGKEGGDATLVWDRVLSIPAMAGAK